MVKIVLLCSALAVALACKTATSSYCEDDQIVSLMYHNQLRRTICDNGAFDGPMLEYDADLAKAAAQDAQATIDAIEAGSRNIPQPSNAQRISASGNKFKSVGRNVAMSSAKGVGFKEAFWIGVQTIATGKAGLKINRKIDNCMTPSDTNCARIAQMVSRETKKVGCGVAMGKKSWAYSCWYGEAGVATGLEIYRCAARPGPPPVPVAAPAPLASSVPVAAPTPTCRTGMSTYCEADQAALIGHHNLLREDVCKSGTYDGVPLKYDEELARFAVEMAARSLAAGGESPVPTSFEERADITRGKYQAVGELSFASNAKLDFSAAFLAVSNAVAAQKQYSSPSGMLSDCSAPEGQTCMNYLQQVASHTTKIGCGMVKGDRGFWHVVCWYAEGGIYRDEPAFKCGPGRPVSAPVAAPVAPSCRTDTTSYCEEDQAALIAHHTTTRRGVCGFLRTIDGPTELVYDADLAKQAADEARRGVLGGSALTPSSVSQRPGRVARKFSSVGETLFASTRAVRSVSDAFLSASQAFAAESVYATANALPSECSRSADRDCTRYMQQVASGATRIGCGYAKDPKTALYHVACWYGESGLSPNKRAYTCRLGFGR